MPCHRKKRSFRIVPNTRGHARYYDRRKSRKGWIHKRTIPKRIASGRFRHLYIKK